MRNAVLLFIMLSACIPLFCFAAPGGWRTDYRRAKNQAIVSKKKLFVAMISTGLSSSADSFVKNVLFSREFTYAASQKYVLYVVDMPNDGVAGAETRYRISQLKARYALGAFPSFLVIEPSGGGLVFKRSGVFAGRTSGAILAEIEKGAKSGG